MGGVDVRVGHVPLALGVFRHEPMQFAERGPRLFQPAELAAAGGKQPYNI